VGAIGTEAVHPPPPVLFCVVLSSLNVFARLCFQHPVSKPRVCLVFSFVLFSCLPFAPLLLLFPRCQPPFFCFEDPFFFFFFFFFFIRLSLFGSLWLCSRDHL